MMSTLFLLIDAINRIYLGSTATKVMSWKYNYILDLSYSKETDDVAKID